jgi:hypothetical protein
MEKIFKAKHFGNGEWVEFNIVDMFFGDDRIYHLDKKTICQYTGINDSEGNRAFFGDSVKDSASPQEFEYIISYCDDEHCVKIGDDPAFEWCLSDLTLTGHNIHDKD